jgi:hypothetical protein
MKDSWTAGLDETRRNEVIQNFKESSVLRRRLLELLAKKIATSNTDSRSKTNYESPSWAFKQADARGYERAMAEIMDIIS